MSARVEPSLALHQLVRHAMAAPVRGVESFTLSGLAVDGPRIALW